MKKRNVYLSIGSNIGDKEYNLNLAIGQIEKSIGYILKVSNFYSNPAEGFIGDYFLKDDYYFYKKELLYILDDNSIGSKGYWKNHKSGNEGVIIVKDYFNNPHCRIIEHVYVNKNKPESFFDTACRENNGSWNVIR